jgi:hypothetical protein
LQLSFALHCAAVVHRVRQLASTQSLPLGHWAPVAHCEAGRGLQIPVWQDSVWGQSLFVEQPRKHVALMQ